MIDENVLNALYLLHQAHKLNKISVENWYGGLSKCQAAILEKNETKLKEALTENLIAFKKQAA